ncbi:MAG: hypothetical protein MUO72_08510 [Bacteroidales bacterium]|nr:hypothetical protein [Bacteroidales bacterium]
MKSLFFWYVFGLGFSFLLSSPYEANIYGQETKFVLTDIKIIPESAKTELTFMAGSDGSVSVEGEMGTAVNKEHPGERYVLDNMFHDSAIHHFKGKIPGKEIERKNGWYEIQVNIDGYLFEGSMEQPLTFRCIYGKGYVYQGGVGTVTMKDGRVVKLSGNK